MIKRNPPDFLIIGASRSGTSSLWKNLQRHPQIDCPEDKEIHFFNNDKRYGKGVDKYRKRFPKIKKGVLYFEASPAYFQVPICAERIYKDLPNGKFIVLLRNPVHRAVSLYLRWNASKDLWKPYELLEKKLYFDYLETGIYVKSFQRWFKYFKRDRFLIIKSEDFYKDEKKTIMQCFEWLNVDLVDIGKPIFFDQRGKVNKWSPYERKMPDDIKEYLRKFFIPHNQELYKLLGRDFGWK